LCGAVKVVVSSASGREVVLDVLEEDELLGELSAIDGGDRSASAVALTAVEVLAIPRDRFARLLATEPTIAAQLMTVHSAFAQPPMSALRKIRS